jgi:hypothetical protein
MGQAIVVLMRVGDDHAKQRLVRGIEPLDFMRGKAVGIDRFQGQANVKN